MKNNMRKCKAVPFILVCLISFNIPFLIAYASGHAAHYSNNIWVSMGNARTNVRWWYTQEGNFHFGYRIQLGANAWHNAPGVDAGFTNVSSATEAEIRVYSKNYGDTGWIGQHIALIGHGDIKLNEYYMSSVEGFSTYEEVFAHEMGHAFGLNHYDCNNELMRPSGYIGTPNPQEGDIAGYKSKYGIN